QGAESLRFRQAALALRPHSPGVWLHFSTALEQLHRLEEAEAAVRRAIELKPDYAEAYSNLGMVLWKHTDRLQEAEAALRRAIELKPDLAQAYVNLGGFLTDRLGRPAEAVAAFRRAIELKPNRYQPHYNL